VPTTAATGTTMAEVELEELPELEVDASAPDEAALGASQKQYGHSLLSTSHLSTAGARQLHVRTAPHAEGAAGVVAGAATPRAVVAGAAVARAVVAGAAVARAVVAGAAVARAVVAGAAVARAVVAGAAVARAVVTAWQPHTRQPHASVR
jgi:hypothetical protein